MAQDTTPSMIIYQGDGSNNVFSVPFDKGYYGTVSVAFVRRGLTEYHYNPTTFTVSGFYYAWAANGVSVYTNTPIPAVGAEIFNSRGEATGDTVSFVGGSIITVNSINYARNKPGDINHNALLTWTGDVLNVGDFICIVRNTELGQPFTYPNNQKHIEEALDNLERQIQEVKSADGFALHVDPSYATDPNKMNPIDWLQTIIRSKDLSVRGLRFVNGWVDYSFDDPEKAEADKEWFHLLNTDNVLSIREMHDIDEEGKDIYWTEYQDQYGEWKTLSNAPAWEKSLEEIKAVADEALEVAEEAKTIAGNADVKSDLAIQKSESAFSMATESLEKSNTALANSEQAVETSGRAEEKADSALSASERAETNSEIAVTTSERAEQKAEQAVATVERAVETSEQALAVANSANQKSDTAVATANEASSVANTALSNSQQAISTADSASTKADEALSASARAESKSDNAVAAAGRAESSAAQAVSTSNQALENSEQALAGVQSAVEAAQRATEAAEAAEQAVQEYDGRIQQAQDDAASALSQVGDKVGFTDYATNNAAGVIKTSDIYAVSTTTSGAIFAQTKTAEQYESSTNNNAFISRGTLENIKTNLVASVGDAKYQGKLTPGTNITIDDNNVISASGNVESVNTKTGVVVLTGEDISADVSELTDTVQGHLQTLHDNIKDIELFKFPNATIIGEPIIDHGQVSGFSESNYLQFPFIVDLHNQPFVIDFCFTTGNDVTAQQNILDSQFGLALAIANGRGLMAISHNGTSWAGSVTGTIAIQPNTTYYARLSWNRILYKTELSTDGTTYTSDMTFGSTQSPYPRTMFIGGCSGSVIGHSAHPFGGTINLNYAYLTVAGNVIWQGMDDAGLSTRANVSLDNLDEFGQAKFDAKQDVISDLATIRSNASAGKSASDTIAGYGNIVTHNANEFQPAGDYATNTALTQGLANKQNKLVAGTNITIDESTNTISATGGGQPTYDEANQRLVF